MESALSSEEELTGFILSKLNNFHLMPQSQSIIELDVIKQLFLSPIIFESC